MGTSKDAKKAEKKAAKEEKKAKKTAEKQRKASEKKAKKTAEKQRKADAKAAKRMSKLEGFSADWRGPGEDAGGPRPPSIAVSDDDGNQIDDHVDTVRSASIVAYTPDGQRAIEAMAAVPEDGDLGGPTRERLKSPSPSDDSSGSPGRARSMSLSVAALDDVTIIEILPDELAEIDRVMASCNDAFTKHELRRLYADFKMNGKKITESDFGIIFATFSRTGSGDALADIAFAMADPASTGEIGFEDFIKFLAIMMKGDAEAKLQFCFSLFDQRHTGALDHASLVQLLSRLPMRNRERELKAAGADAAGMPEPALSVVAEQDEDPETIAAIEQEQYSAYKNSKTLPRNKLTAARGASSIDTSSGASERRPTMQPTKAYVQLAETIVDEAYNDLGKDYDDVLTLGDFLQLCQSSGVADYFVPL